MPVHPYKSNDKHYERLQYIALGMALADRDARKKIAKWLTPTTLETLDSIPRKMLRAIVDEDGEQVWANIAQLGVEKPEEGNARAADLMMDEIKRQMEKHLVRRAQERTANAYKDDATSLAEMLKSMVEELTEFSE